MAKFRGERDAFGKPGIPPRWTHGSKDGVGTAYSASSRTWFTVWNGILTEAYYPTVDRPQIRDLQYLLTDGETFFHEEKRHLETRSERISPRILGYRLVNVDPGGRYSVTKEIIADPHLPCILQRTILEGEAALLSRLRIYALCAPHLEGGGAGNNGYVVSVAGREILAAEKGGVWLALGADVPFARLSCGYVGRSDGWTDLADNFRMDWEFDRALDGNIALTAEVRRDGRAEFTLGLAFGDSLHNAATTLFQALGTPFAEQRERYAEQWARAYRKILPLDAASGDGGNLFHASCTLLQAHEDKSYPGAFIASMSIPWGEARGDEDMGGYHLVWTRDMVNSVTGLMAAGHTGAALKGLIYLAASQNEDGGFPQNFWIDGTPYWRGIQLDEVAFPVLLAWRLDRENALGDFDPYPMVMSAARYLIHHGPATAQERWEEASGYSPSTLASSVAALVCAAGFARRRGDGAAARFLGEYADFLESRIERWTVTTAGTLLPGVPRHYIRILPVDVHDPRPVEDPDRGELILANRRPGTRYRFPANEIVDAGFLELVRYGIRRPDDPVVEDSLRVVDAVLKVETPAGPCWRRYNHDGFGQREDGGPYDGWGTGRAWPLLTGERGHYELAAGRDPAPFIRAMERFASATGCLPEQVWDEAVRTRFHMAPGHPTGAAMPLMWAHAEYLKLLRSAADGAVFDRIPDVAARYGADRKGTPPEVWKPNRRVAAVRRGETLRVQAPEPFILHWSATEWESAVDLPSESAVPGIDFADIPVPPDQGPPVRFTFFWKRRGAWEGRDYEVRVV